MTTTTPESETPAPKSGGAYAHYVLMMLCITNVLAISDRGVMSLLLEPIKRDLGASDTQMSLLTGAAFVLFYSLFGIPIARWSDRGIRRDILALGVAVWSAMTVLCGLSQNFLQIAAARAGVGMGEAAGTPTSMSLIADYYRREIRPQMVALYNLAQPLGTVCVTPVLGLVADNYGWRAAFIVLGVPGIIVGLLVRFTVREPARGATDVNRAQSTEQATLRGALRAMGQSPPFLLLLLGTAVAGLGVGTVGAWGPAVAMRAFGVSATEIALTYSPFSAIAGFAGTILGGFLTSAVVKKTKDQRWMMILPAFAQVLMIPGGLFYAFGQTWPMMIFGGMIGAFTVGFRTSPQMALMMDLMPANCRGMAVSAIVIATSVVGLAGGPLVVGVISDALKPTMGDLGGLRAALIFAPITMAMAAIPFFWALRYCDANGVKPQYRHD